MPSSRQTKPIVIVAPKPTSNPSTLSPAVPPSPKQVRFAPRSAELATRTLTPQEAWSLYHFETHARGCRECSSHSLCSTGYGLSQDVQVLICQHGGEICSTRPDSEGKWVRVEIPHGYDRAKSMLGVERKRGRKHAPIVNYDTAPRPSREPRPRANAFSEPAQTHKVNERPKRYQIVEVETAFQGGEPVQLPESTKRGTLYESYMRRPRREYRIEERTPERKESSQDRERKEREREERRERRRRERELREGGWEGKPTVEESNPRETIFDQPSVQSYPPLVKKTRPTRYVCQRLKFRRILAQLPFGDVRTHESWHRFALVLLLIDRFTVFTKKPSLAESTQIIIYLRSWTKASI